MAGKPPPLPGHELLEYRWIHSDAAPTNVPGSSFMKAALFNTALQAFKSFHLVGFAFAAIITPSTPQGSYSGPFRTRYEVSHINSQEVFPNLVGLPTQVDPSIASGMITAHETVANDGATLIVQAREVFDRPILISKPSFGIQVNYRISTELGHQDVELLVRD